MSGKPELHQFPAKQPCNVTATLCHFIACIVAICRALGALERVGFRDPRASTLAHAYDEETDPERCGEIVLLLAGVLGVPTHKQANLFDSALAISDAAENMSVFDRGCQVLFSADAVVPNYDPVDRIFHNKESNGTHPSKLPDGGHWANGAGAPNTLAGYYVHRRQEGVSAVAAAEPDVVARWVCFHCTYSNTDRSDYCFICKRARDAQSVYLVPDAEFEAAAYKAVATSARWVCNVCTYDNHGVADRCICGTLRSAQLAPAVSVRWACRVCTYDNHCDVDKCICGALRGAQQAAPAGSGWVCNVCSVSNDEAAADCAACTSERPAH